MQQAMKRELNLRDLGSVGGGIVPKGLFLRSGKLSILTPEQCSRLCNKYGVKCVIDLRTPVESAEFPDPLPEGIEYLQIPLLNDAAVGIAASQGNFELNVFMPVLIYNYLQSVRLLADVLDSFRTNCVCGIKANRGKMQHNLHNSLMLVTALNPYIGYENAAKTAKLAYKENISLKEACVSLGFLNAEKFDEVFHPEEMI